MANQESLLPPEPALKRHQIPPEYRAVFPTGVLPTGGIEVLEQGGHLLFIKNYGKNQAVTKAQYRIWGNLPRFGADPDAPGSITVICVWRPNPGARFVRIFDHTGKTEHAWTTDELRDWLQTWWRGASNA